MREDIVSTWAFGALLAAGLLAGCSLGPHYVKPTPPLPPTFAEADAKAGIYDSTRAPPSALWHSFGDPLLDRLLSIALDRNQTLAQALAQLNEARALRGLEVYSLLPTVTAAGSAQREKPSRLDPFSIPGVGTVNDFQAGFDASWEIDLFGGLLSADRAARAEEAAAAASLRGAQQAVLAEVAQAYFGLRGEQERLRLQVRSIANLEENQQLLEDRFDAGRGTQLDVARSRTLLLSASARLPQIESAIVRDEERLAVLTAEPIDQLRGMLGSPTPIPPLPTLVAVGTPQEWLQRRPDVIAAERNLASATALIGVDAADYLPHLTLLGNFGWTSQLAKSLGTAAAERWQFGPSISWSFLDIGRVRQRVRASTARAAGSLATYEDTVLRALEETDNALAGYRNANRSAVMLEQAAVSARAATDLARRRFDAGAEDTLAVLDAERTELDVEDQFATSEEQRATALAALYKALVGDFAAVPQ
jgi:multidrug efflux system outer membrane protein